MSSLQTVHQRIIFNLTRYRLQFLDVYLVVGGGACSRRTVQPGLLDESDRYSRGGLPYIPFIFAAFRLTLMRRL